MLCISNTKTGPRCIYSGEIPSTRVRIWVRSGVIRRDMYTRRILRFCNLDIHKPAPLAPCPSNPNLAMFLYTRSCPHNADIDGKGANEGLSAPPLLILGCRSSSDRSGLISGDLECQALIQPRFSQRTRAFGSALVSIKDRAAQFPGEEANIPILIPFFYSLARHFALIVSVSSAVFHVVL